LSFLDESVQAALQSAGSVAVDQIGRSGFIQLFGCQAELGGGIVKLATFNSGSHLANL